MIDKQLYFLYQAMKHTRQLNYFLKALKKSISQRKCIFVKEQMSI